MKKNMGIVDRYFRILVAVIIAVLYSSNIITGVLGVGLVIVAIIFAITSLIGVCPLYFPFGISTQKKKKESSAGTGN